MNVNVQVEKLWYKMMKITSLLWVLLSILVKVSVQEGKSLMSIHMYTCKCACNCVCVCILCMHVYKCVCVYVCEHGNGTFNIALG